MAQAPRQIVGTNHSGIYSDGAGGSYKSPYGSPSSPSSLNAPTSVVIECGDSGFIVNVNSVEAPNPDGTRYEAEITDTSDNSVRTVRSEQCDAGVLPDPFVVRDLVNSRSYNVKVKAKWGPTLASSSVDYSGIKPAP